MTRPTKQTMRYVWFLIDKYDMREINAEQLAHRIIQEWMMNVPRGDEE